MTRIYLRACSASLRARLARFLWKLASLSVIFNEFALQYNSMAATNSLHLTKNLAAQYAHAEILNRLIKKRLSDEINFYQ